MVLYHASQAIREKDLPERFQLVGLVHDEAEVWLLTFSFGCNLLLLIVV